MDIKSCKFEINHILLLLERVKRAFCSKMYPMGRNVPSPYYYI